MKFLLKVILLCFFLFSYREARAVPADNTPVSIIQADGTRLTIILNGDEFFSYTTTLSGHTIEQKDGFYYYVNYDMNGKMQFSSQRASQKKDAPGEYAYLSRRQVQNMSHIAPSVSRLRRQQMFSGVQKTGFPTTKKVKAILILVEYQDIKFTVPNPNQVFHNQLNQDNYTTDDPDLEIIYGEQVVGSAKQYFEQASGGIFDVDFDVVGPYTLTQTMKYYGEDNSYTRDHRIREMIGETVRLADPHVDFSQYDYSKDGYIDNVYVVYAGYAQSTLGVSSDAIWPQGWVVDSPQMGPYDGKWLSHFACSSELRGWRGTNMTGIGTFLHEFGHVLGLADHYDLNGSIGGDSQGLGRYDIMTMGSRNRIGFLPPMYTALEMEMCGWLTPIVLRESNGNFELPTIDHHVAYKIETEVEGEYFLIENRRNDDSDNIWDNGIPGSGMMITHVDRSSAASVDWSSNGPNNDVSRERYRIVPAESVNLGLAEDWLKLLYHSGRNSSFNLTSSPSKARSWANIDLPYGISNISESKLVMTFTGSKTIGLFGTVKDDSGVIIADVNICFEKDGKETYFITDEDGRYFSLLNLIAGSYNVSLNKLGYSDVITNVNVSAGLTHDFTMAAALPEEESGYTIAAWQTDAEVTWESEEYEKFELVLENHTGIVNLFLSEKKIFHITDLEPRTDYGVIISGIDKSGVKTKLFFVKFTTIPRITDFPLIYLSDYEYPKSTPIQLKAINLFKADTVSWKIDGKDILEMKVLLEAGKHSIRADVKRGETEYVVVKNILVK